jgi:hypothetical protein
MLQTTHPSFSSYPQKKYNRPFQQDSRQRGLGGVFSAIALRPEATLFHQPLNLSDEEQRVWKTQQTLPHWQPLNLLASSVREAHAPVLFEGVWYRKLLPMGALAITLTVILVLGVGVVHTGQQLLAQYSQAPTEQHAYAVLANTNISQEEAIHTTAVIGDVIQGSHPLEKKAVHQKANFGLGLLATAAASKNNTAIVKDYRRADPLKPSIELIKHFAPKPEQSMYGGNTERTPAYGTVRPFPTASMGRVNTSYPTPSLPTGSATPSISIEEQSIPAMRFVGWVKSDVPTRSVALIEVVKPNSGDGNNTVQTIAKPLNTPFLAEGQSVTLKKLRHLTN